MLFRVCVALAALTAFGAASVAWATPAGARPDARHPWSVHDEHRPNPPQVETAEGLPPSDATVLFDGTAASVARNWRAQKDGPTKWRVADGLFTCVPGSGMVRTAEEFGDCQLHVEWRVPANDRWLGNSGVYLMGRYEVQILDSYGATTNEDPFKPGNYADGQAGALYGQNPPAVNAARPAGAWQSYDIVFHPPHHENGVETEPATITVFHNGVLVQDNRRLEGPTTWAARVKPKNDGVEKGPVMLQDHGTPVLFRNIWIRRLASPHAPERDVAQLRGELAARAASLAAAETNVFRKLIYAYEVNTYRRDDAALAFARTCEPDVIAALDKMDADACCRRWTLVDELGWWSKMGVKAGFLAEDSPLVRSIARANKAWRDRGCPTDSTTPADPDDVNPHDYTVYLPTAEKQVNEHFLVLPNPKTGRLLAFWTQESWEGSSDMHIMFARSEDGGRNWSKARLLWGSPKLDSGVPNAVWPVPMVSKSGRLYCVWNQREKAGGGMGVGLMMGAKSDDDGETWSEPVKLMDAKRWCVWQRPMRLTKDGRFLTAVSIITDGLSKTCFLRFENVDDDPDVKDLRFTILGEKNALDGEEASIVKLPDGRLFAVMRSRFGVPLWTMSKDGGETWSDSKAVMAADGRVVRHPRAPCPLYDLAGDAAASGSYFALFTDAFDPKVGQWAGRGPLFRYDGAFDPKGGQPVRFTQRELLMPRDGKSHYGNSCYSSFTCVNGEGVLWYPDNKRRLYGVRMDMVNGGKR